MPDRLAHIPELEHYVCFAVDMHWHQAAVRDARHLLRHLAVGEGLHEHDMSVLRRLTPKGLRQGVPKGQRVLVIYDKAGVCLGFWKRCRHECAVYFISRIKEAMVYEALERRTLDRSDPRCGGVEEDLLVRMSDGQTMRIIRYVGPLTGKVYEFLTNEMDLPAAVMVELYRRRWDVGKMFDQLKNKVAEHKSWAKSRLRSSPRMRRSRRRGGGGVAGHELGDDHVARRPGARGGNEDATDGVEIWRMASGSPGSPGSQTIRAGRHKRQGGAARPTRTAKFLDARPPLRRTSRRMTERQKEEMARLVREQIKLVGEDPAREGLLRTPARVAESFDFLTSGYALDPMTVLNDALFSTNSDEMVIVKDIDFYSLCEHHMLPFFGKCHIAYIPRKKVIGLSKLPRLVDVHARRLQIQERMTFEIATTVKKLINAQGVGVVIEAQHLCMMMRGVEKQNSYAITSTMLGAFRDDPRTRSEFLNLINHHRG